MKTIKYQSKTVKTGNAKYRTISESDKQWCLETCRVIHDLTEQLSESPAPSELRRIYLELVTPTTAILRQGTGELNSVYTAVTGVISNITTNARAQRDFTDKTCILLEQVLDITSNLIQGIDSVVFTEEVFVATDIDRTFFDWAA